VVDKVLDLHLILDNYSTHKTKQVHGKLQTALNPDLIVLAQFGRAVLCLDYLGRHPPWRLQERSRT
jgi:hypothetical protein